MKYPSITTENIDHDAANMLAEFIWLNKDIRCGSYPWGGQNSKDWGKLVAALKKLMSAPYGLTAEQLGFYIWECKPRFINPRQFAKMAVVARRLLTPMNLEQVSILYQDWRRELSSSGLEHLAYKANKPKNLLTFLRELESGKTSQS
jgi:hypothetical protein